MAAPRPATRRPRLSVVRSGCVEPTPAATDPASRAPLVVHCIGARSGFIRVAPVIAELERRGDLRQTVVDLCPPDSRPCDASLAEAGFPSPGRAVPPGAGTHGERLARTLLAVERVLLADRPALVMVSGAADATLACALAAAKVRAPVAYLQAGLRSFDWGSSEEVNREVVDRLSDALFTQTWEALDNLRREGITDGRTHYVGTTVVDWLRRFAPTLRDRPFRHALGLDAYEYVVVALRKRATVDDPARAARLGEGLRRLAARAPVVAALAPRAAGAPEPLSGMTGLRSVGVLDPVDFLALVREAGAVVTDSSSIQEEASALGVPCFTLGSTTECPATLAYGTNTLLGDDPDLAFVADGRRPPVPCAIPAWDGRASERIADIVLANFVLRRGARVPR